MALLRGYYIRLYYCCDQPVLTQLITTPTTSALCFEQLRAKRHGKAEYVRLFIVCGLRVKHLRRRPHGQPGLRHVLRLIAVQHQRLATRLGLSGSASARVLSWVGKHITSNSLNGSPVFFQPWYFKRPYYTTPYFLKLRTLILYNIILQT